MSGKFESDELDEKKDLSHGLRVFTHAIHQRKVIMEALKDGTLSCLPGSDGYADTQPAINIKYRDCLLGVNLLYLKEHQKEKSFPTGEYITAGLFDKAQQDNPELCISKGERELMIYNSVEKLNAEGELEYEDVPVRLFNVAQTNKPSEVKAWAEQNMRSKFGSDVRARLLGYPEQRPKGTEPEITCNSTEPAKYLGQYLAAVSMGGKFKVSPEQASKFAKNIEAVVYKKTITSLKTGKKTLTNPFMLSKISNEAIQHCKTIEARMFAQAQKVKQPEQKAEQQRSRGRGR